MHDPRGNARQSAQGGSVIEIAPQRRQTFGPQFDHTLGLRRQCQQMHPGVDLGCHAQAYITTTDNQESFAPKPRRQGAKGGLV